MKQKIERRLEELEGGTQIRPVKLIIRDADGTVLNEDGTPCVEDPEPLPPGCRVIEIVIVDPPNRPPWTNPQVEPTVKPQVRH